MILNNDYTTTQATKDVLDSLEAGRKYTGRDLHNRIINKLREHGNPANPYDSSTLRMVRAYGRLYGVRCDKAGVRSVYRKEVLF